MSEPEVKFEIDEHGRIGYRVTNEGVLLSKDEKEFIIDHVTRMQEENAKLRELCKKLYRLADESYVPFKDVNPWMNEFDNAIRAMRELGIEVDE